KNDKEAFRYFKIATAAKDSLFSQDKMKQMLSLSFEEKQRQQDIETAKANYRNQVKLYVLGGALVMFLLLATILLRNNRQKQKEILNHSKRYDAILKGMLQHSRVSTGQKELTDINALADEYLRLSYHGMRAKDKLFNATLQTDFDATIGKINIVPQDIGRVLLNLFNNSFY